MKKNRIIALGLFLTIGALFMSCGGNISKNVSLKTEIDTISYAFGANLYTEGGLNTFLTQSGIVGDTAMVRAQYTRIIAAETTSSAKDSLTKEMNFKIDSIAKVNPKHIAEFLKGVKASIDVSASEQAYYAGINIGNQLGQQMLPNIEAQLYNSESKMNIDAFMAALATAMEGGKFTLPGAESLFNEKVQAIQAKQKAIKDEELKEQYANKIAVEAKFFEENKAREGVVTLPSGVQYEIIKKGSGATPTITDRVKAHYQGTLVDGTVFDSSIERGIPSSFRVNGVIQGWTEVLQLMPERSKWRVYIPYDLAYGSAERDVIKPFSNLIFDIELINVEK